jgi:hypothetical protein
MSDIHYQENTPAIHTPKEKNTQKNPSKTYFFKSTIEAILAGTILIEDPIQCFCSLTAIAGTYFLHSPKQNKTDPYSLEGHMSLLEEQHKTEEAKTSYQHLKH